MSYVKPEQIEQARRIDLLSYLQMYQPNELVHVSGGTYCTRSHDSLKMSNGKWYWWSRGIGGKSALDYLVKVEGLAFTDAVERLTGTNMPELEKSPALPKSGPKELILPDRSPTNQRVIRYLCSRGIDSGILHDCIKKGMIYESTPYHNAVFVGLDATGKARYASFRATNSTRIMGDCSGSDKHYSFRLVGNRSADVHFFECAIDALSYATLLKRSGRDWQNYNLISLAGVYLSAENDKEYKLPLAVEEYMKEHPQHKRVFLHFDNDEIGRGAAQALKKGLEQTCEVIDQPPPGEKDYNDYLKKILKDRCCGRDSR